MKHLVGYEETEFDAYIPCMVGLTLGLLCLPSRQSDLLSSCNDGLPQVYRGDWEPSRHQIRQTVIDHHPGHQARELHAASHLVVDHLQSQPAQAAAEG
jgi:hypothetical protein